jgi:lipoprotein-releasing system permease protein
MPFELFVAMRYLREGRGQTWLILAGVAVGVGVIVFLSALIGGLQDSLITRTLGSQAHIVVRAPEDMPRVLARSPGAVREVRIERPAQRVRSIVQWQQARDEIARLPGVVATAPTVAGSALATRGGGANSVAVRGIEPESHSRIINLDSMLREGAVELQEFRAVIGLELARVLGLSIGDRFQLSVEAPSGARSTGTYTVSGIFDLGNEDLNERWVFVSLRAAQSMFGLEGGVSTIEVKVGEIYDAERVATEIAGRTGLVADSWMRTNAQLLAGLQSQSASSVMIQVFVILAVALGIASVLAVSVVQKSREIGILRATGTSTRQVLRIYLIQGGAVGVAGSVLGIAIGIGLGVLFSRLSLNPDGTPRFPVTWSGMLYLRTAAIALGVGLAAALLPARRAARMDPAQVMRNG